nr:MAG TPA: hypothetical protein [Caudoviricetes sp.]
MKNHYLKEFFQQVSLMASFFFLYLALSNRFQFGNKVNDNFHLKQIITR